MEKKVEVASAMIGRAERNTGNAGMKDSKSDRNVTFLDELLGDGFGKLLQEPMRNEQKKIQVDGVNEAGEPVSYANLVISNIAMASIEDFYITSKVNEHAALKFSGLLQPGMGEMTVNSTTVGSPLEVFYYSNSGKNIPFFTGVITDIRLCEKNGSEWIEVNALSNSGSMDMCKKSRTFQNINASYKEVMNTVIKENGASVDFGLEGNQFKAPLGCISVQYKETDWEYMRRLASHKYQGLYVDMTATLPSFTIGPCGKSQGDIEELMYQSEKDIRGYEVDNANYIQGVTQSDYLVYKVTTYRILQIGDKVTFQGKELYIREAEYRMKQAVVEATYCLCTEAGLKQRKCLNRNIQGLSINGTTVSVVRDKVKIQLDIDSQENAEYLFPYSTMSASPDGSGWYCMPETGDLLRVYFPDEEEQNCFAISSVSSYTPEEGNTSDRMSDPSVKYLRTADNKEVKLTPEGIIINADDGQAVIMMDNAGNITISGANSINLTASNDVTIAASRNISLYATENIKVSGQSGSIEMCQDGNTKLTGEYVVEN